MTDDVRETITVQEFMRVLGISKRPVYNGISSGRIPAFRIMRKYLISKRFVDQLLDNPGAVERLFASSKPRPRRRSKPTSTSALVAD